MIQPGPTIVIDIDGTICPVKTAGQGYGDLLPDPEVVARLRSYKAAGFAIVLSTSRTMRTHDGNLGLITLHTVPELVAWLRAHDIPCDELHMGKPWPGQGGFYVDDRAIRPDEFKRLDYEGITALLGGHG